jgi:hypothetical protein
MLKTLGEAINSFINGNPAIAQTKKLSFLEARLEELKDIDLS